MADPTQAVVLAAGRGTRMRSELVKVLHPLGGRPLVEHALAAAREACGGVPVVVVPPDAPALRRLLDGRATLVEQAVPRGTGDALRAVPAALRSAGPVLVTNGDVPLVTAASMRRLLDGLRGGVRCALLTVTPADPRGLGRVVRDGEGRVAAVVEERDLGADAAALTECNAGVYAFEGAALWPVLDGLSADNAQGEQYLTDVVAALAPAVGIALAGADADEAIGVNDRRDLAAAEAALRRRVLDALMLDGVTVEDPATTYVDAEVVIGRDTVLRPMTVIRGATTLGEGCEVGPRAELRDVRAGRRVTIGSSVLDGCELEDDVRVGHYVRVRPGTRLRRHVYLGTHAEVKNSDLGAHSHVSHFACVLDSDIGESVNVSAGTVTCNYDGLAKHRTVVKDGAFIGSDTMLVAPVTIGAGAYVGAGSVITKDVPDGALAVERAPQRTVAGWVERRARRGEAAGA